MKKLLISFLVVIFSIQSGYAQIKAKVQERFELTSVMSTLAGVSLYNQCGVPSYYEDILSEFRQYEMTEPINYVRELYQIHGMGCSTVARSAEMMEIKNGKIKLMPQYDISKVSEHDPFWTKELFSKYLKMINIFYKESNFHQFYQEHAELYDLAEQRFNTFLEGINYDWFQSFYGKPFNPEMDVYVSLVNGQSNYAMRKGIIIGCLSDSKGLPDFNPAITLNVIIHEIAHHYSNPIFFKYWSQMEAAANLICPYVEDKLNAAGYSGGLTMTGEWLNQLCTLMYLKENHSPYLDILIAMEAYQGFIWMRNSVEFMDNFYDNRNRYPYIEDFMPQLISFFNHTADNIEFILRDYENERPFITSIYPAIGSDISGFDEIVITFSKPMMTSGYGFDNITDENINDLSISKIEWINDRQIRIVFDMEKIEDNCTYGLKLFPTTFVSTNCFSMEKQCKDLIFNTMKE